MCDIQYSYSYMSHIIDSKFSHQVFAGGVLGFAVATFTAMIAGLGSWFSWLVDSHLHWSFGIQIGYMFSETVW